MVRPEPMNRPVPIAPPIAISCRCRFFNERCNPDECCWLTRFSVICYITMKWVLLCYKKKTRAYHRSAEAVVTVANQSKLTSARHNDPCWLRVSTQNVCARKYAVVDVNSRPAITCTVGKWSWQTLRTYWVNRCHAAAVPHLSVYLRAYPWLCHDPLRWAYCNASLQIVTVSGFFCLRVSGVVAPSALHGEWRLSPEPFIDWSIL